MNDKSEKFVGINKFCDSIKEITEGHKSITVYFINYNRSKYYDNQINIEPIGYVLNGEGVNKFVSYYEIHKFLPLMKFIKFTENKNRKLTERTESPQGKAQQNKLYRLVIMLEESKTHDIVYHNSKILDGNEKLTDKLLQNFKEDRNRIVDEQINMIEEEFGEITEIDLESI
jgi:hypothetical protein